MESAPAPRTKGGHPGRQTKEIDQGEMSIRKGNGRILIPLAETKSKCRELE